MACARGANEEDGACNPDISRSEDGRDPQGSEDEVQRSILVSYIPEGVNEDKLEIHFMKKRNGGGDIESVTMVTDTEAKITYLDGAAVESILEKPHVLNGVEVKVQKWTPPEVDTKSVMATAEISRSILVSNIPDGVNMDKLQIHFMRRSNGGDDIESITMVTDTEARITYLDGAAVETVLARPQVLKGVEVRVQKWTSPKTPKQDTKVGATKVETSRSILVSNIPRNVTRDELETYFTKVSNGGGIESITMVTEAVAIITYLDRTAMETVLGRQHAYNGIPVNVQEWQPEEVFDEIHATVEPKIACHIPQSEVNKIKHTTGVSWEKHLVDDVIEVKGTFTQVEEAQKLLQQWIKQRMSATNGPVSATDKNSKEAGKIGPSSVNDPKGNMATKGGSRITVTGLEDKKKSDGDMAGKKTQVNASEKSHLDIEAAAKDGRITREDRHGVGEMVSEGTVEKMPFSSNQDDADVPQDGMKVEEEHKRTSSEEEKPTQVQEEQDHDAEREGDGEHPQQTSDQEKDVHTVASSTLDDKQGEEKLKAASSSSNEKTSLSSMGSETRTGAEGIEGVATAEEQEEMETEEVPGADIAQRTPLPVSDEDEPMPSDEDEQQAKASRNSGQFKESKADSSDGHMAEDHRSINSIPPADSVHHQGDEHDFSPTHVDAHEAHPDNPETLGSFSADESPEAPNVQVMQSSGAEKRKMTSHSKQQENNFGSDEDFAEESTDSSKVMQSRKAKKTKQAFFTEKLEECSGPVDNPRSVVNVSRESLPASTQAKVDSTDSNDPGSSGPSAKEEENPSFEVLVDPDVLKFIQHTHHEKISQIAKRYKSVFHVLSADTTKVCFVPASPSFGKDPEPEKAIDEFTTLYQQVFSKITCENFNVVQYNLAPKRLLEGVRQVRHGHPEVLTKATDDDTTVMFMGEPEKIRAARADFCGMMGIPVSRGSRRGGNNPAKSNSARAQESTPLGAQGGVLGPTPFYHSKLPQGVEVIVARGDITSLEVDTIVNASDSKLQHGGGVAKAIVLAGGSVIQEESTAKMQKRSPLQPAEVETTGAGSLPCRHIIHAHGPKWQETLAKECSFVLKQTCINILQAAEDLQAESVAIPAISSGKYGIPKHICAQSLLFGVMEYLINRHKPSCHLRKIWFIDTAGETVEVLAEVFASEISLLLSGCSSGMPENAKTAQAKNQVTAGAPTGASPPLSMSYAKAAARGTGSVKHKNDSSQMTALITQNKGMAYGTRKDAMFATGGTSSTRDAPEKEKVKTSQKGKDKNTTCPICLSEVKNPKSLPCKDKGCKAVFCQDCMDKALKNKSCCPVCNAVVGKLTGNQPKGTMNVTTANSIHLPGYPKCGTITIEYAFRSGVQGLEHPNPGKPFTGTRRTAYLPDNGEGRGVLELLQKAFNQRLTFTIGTSATTGKSDTVVWNDIHHKTSTVGQYGYPDKGYLKRVREELAAKGIK